MPKQNKIDIRYKGKLVASGVVIADTYWAKLSGFMFRKKPHVSGILFESSGGIQTTFMSFDLDLVFLTDENHVVQVLRGIKPWRLTWSYSNTRRVLEMPTGVLPSELEKGEVLEILPT